MKKSQRKPINDMTDAEIAEACRRNLITGEKMPKYIDLTGKKFGRLTVLSKVENLREWDIQGNVVPKPTTFLCRCDCGTQKEVNASNLKRGLTRSCGCLAREMKKNNKYAKKEVTKKRRKPNGKGRSLMRTDPEIIKKARERSSFAISQKTKEFANSLRGFVFGNLKVIGYGGTKKNHLRLKAKCLLCGTVKSYARYSLESGNTRSCGCAKKLKCARNRESMVGRESKCWTVEGVGKRLKKRGLLLIVKNKLTGEIREMRKDVFDRNQPCMETRRKLQMKIFWEFERLYRQSETEITN